MDSVQIIQCILMIAPWIGILALALVIEAEIKRRRFVETKLLELTQNYGRLVYVVEAMMGGYKFISYEEAIAIAEEEKEHSSIH